VVGGAGTGLSRMSRRPKPPPPGTRPRTFEEVRAANLKDAFHAARLARLDSGESFDGVSVHPDCEGGSHWIVEWLDSDGGCYVTTFDGPLAERGARLLRRRHGRRRWPPSRRVGGGSGQPPAVLPSIRSQRACLGIREHMEACRCRLNREEGTS
jgi:hypothetical protein